MGFINRFFLFLYSLFFALLSLGVVLLTAQIVPEHDVWNEFLFASHQWQTGAGAFFIFLLSVHFLGASLSRSKKSFGGHEVIVVQGVSGEVRVAVDAVRHMIDRAAGMIPGVQKADVKVSSQAKEGKLPRVFVAVRLVIGPERKVTEISDALQESIHTHLEQIVGIQDFEVKISVADIAQPTGERKQRVV